MTRFEQLCEITGKLGEQQQTIIKPLLEDIVFMEARLCELRKLPHLRVHPKNPARQEVTPAGKQYKEIMQSYLNAVKVIMTALNRNDTSAADELISKLEEFQI